VLPDFPKDNQTESQAVELAAFHPVEGLVDLHLPEPTPNLQLEHTVDHPRSVLHPCHLKLSDTTGSLLHLSQKPPLPPASPVFGFLPLPTQLGPPLLGFPPTPGTGLTARPTDLTGSWLTDVAAFTAGAGLTAGAGTELTAVAAAWTS